MFTPSLILGKKIRKRDHYNQFFSFWEHDYQTTPTYFHVKFAIKELSKGILANHLNKIDIHY